MDFPTYFRPDRPVRYGYGPELPVGTYTICATAQGFTVCRQIGAERWFPLSSRVDPHWMDWPSLVGCQGFASGRAWGAKNELHEFDCADWPHWGAL